jgi:outer membrane protein insertion porin family
VKNKKAKEKSRKPKDGRCILLPFYFLILNFVFMLVSGCASAPSHERQVLERVGKAGKNIVRSIDFRNNRAFKDKTLREKLDFKVGDFLDPILAESGKVTLSEFYRQKGFPDARVTLDSNSLPQGKVTYTIDEGSRVKIRKIRFKGNKAIKTSDLRKVIKLETREWFIWPSYYTEEKVAADVERLRDIYYQRGFLNHSIRAEGQAYVTFIIEEGPVYKVGKIILTGNKFFDLAAVEKLRSGLKLESGRVYNQRSADSYAAAIRRLYRENGFIDADVQQRVVFREAGTNIVDVEFDITEGSQFRIGRIDISGNEVTQDRVIRRILDEYDFTPGQLYNANIAPKEGGGRLERDVQRMLLTEQTIIRPVSPADRATDRKDVSVDIKEGLTGMWSPGVAVGSDAGVIGRLVFQQRNFDIADWPESFGEFITMKAFRGAGQTLRASLEPGTQVSQYSVSFTEPYFRDRPTSMDVVGSSYARGRESYYEGRLRSYLGFEQRLKNRWRRSLSFRLENVDVADIDFDAPKEIKDVAGNNLLGGVGVGVGRDMVDDRFTPSRGYSFDAGYEQVTGDETFGILRGSYVWYRTLYEDLLGRKTVWATKLQGATVVGDAPPFEKFYAGGTGTYGIRGFRYRGVSTRGWQTNVPTPQCEDPIGSDWIFLASSEVTMPLIGENFSALFFMDSGTIDTGGYRASVGAGIQIQIPQWFGPVPMRFELAMPVMKNDQDRTQTFSFSVGGLF